ncbi:hypothetical protein JB92DRAFT_3098477 [Gautieria morchelliformis]|nr:hypothetical protein JB92DRAFT_3098477 [Gautieria morchelliformis]
MLYKTLVEHHEAGYDYQILLGDLYSRTRALIVRRRLEHAGYDAADGLENLGADEIQFLLKLVFKTEQLGGDQNPLLEIPLNFIQLCEILRELPFVQLKKLGFLNISNNKLDVFPRLPPELGQLCKLERLVIVGNQVSEFPEQYWKLLRADYNMVHAVDLSLDSSFKSLEITNNDITRLALVPGPVRTKPFSLTRLDISHAKVSSLDDFALAALTSAIGTLNTISTSHPLPPLPPPLARSLKRLYLGDNRLEDDVFHPLNLLRELTVLNLSFNQIQEPQVQREQLRVWLELLRYLNFCGNKRLAIRPPDNSHSKKFMSNNTSTESQMILQKQLAEFTGLKDLRVLGLMEVTTLFMPSIPHENGNRRVRTLPPEINGMTYGIADTLGELEHGGMFDLVLPSFRSKEDECLFGILRPLANNNKVTKFLHENFPRTFTGP